jgi:EAL domain-containing protein (putative c-di-GMP-specific phosphodiesterase class I)
MKHRIILAFMPLEWLKFTNSTRSFSRSFTGAMDDNSSAQKETTDRLITALQENKFVLYAQMIVPLASGGDDRPFQEILVRLREEEEKLLPPGSFFPILEEYRLMPYVDRWVVSHLAKRMTTAETEQPDSPRPRNSINLSADTLRDEKNFAEFVQKRVERNRLPEGTFTFEFPWDTAILHAEPLMKLAEKLKPHGCHFTVAGFDGSKTSFDTLKRLRPNFVKLDYGIVKDIVRALAASERAESVSEKCHTLGIKTIAEYVESAEALEQLQLVGVDYAQGLAISPPEPLS